MPAQRVQGHPVLIIGAGRGGSALLEMFMEEDLVTVVAMADTNPEAPGLAMAHQFGIPTYNDAIEAIRACRDYPDCIVYNLSHDDKVAGEVRRVFGDKHAASGPEVMLFWQMVTRLKQTKVELEKSQHQLQAIISNVMDGIITINEHGEIQGFNPAAEGIFGFEQDEVVGKNISILMDEPDRSAHDRYLERYLRSGHSEVLGVRGREVTAVRKNGEAFPMELSASEMILGGQRYFIGIVRDITERKLAELKIQHLAHYDYLTDLPNRALFIDILDHSIALARRNQFRSAVLFLDLDGFKKINDSLGHEAGDLVLQEVAKRITSTLRDSDTVARVGGDEFVLVLDNIGPDQNAALVAGKILAALAVPFDLGGQPGMVGGSIGVAFYPDDAEEVRELVQHADEAMYLAKQNGKNNCKFYADVLRQRRGS